MTLTDEPATLPVDLDTVSTSLSPDTVPEPDPALVAVANTSSDRCSPETPSIPQVRYRPLLKQSPLTHAAPLENTSSPDELSDMAGLLGSLPSATAAVELSINDRLQLPSPCIWLSRYTDAPTPEIWTPVRDLLSSHANSEEFVVEVETDGATYLRFGDDILGARPLSGPNSLPPYRIGNGSLAILEQTLWPT